MPLSTSLSTQVQVTTQMVLAGALLRLPAGEIDDVIRHELAENLALESAVQTAADRHFRQREPLPCQPAWPAAGRGGRQRWDAGAQETFLANLVAPQSPREQLVEQARLQVPSCELVPVTALIDRLDGHGYLRSTVAELACDIGVDEERVRAGLSWLHQLGPPGIGARDLRECFLLQCRDLQERGIDCGPVPEMLTAAWDHFSRQAWAAVARALGLSRAEIDAALHFIRQNLYPYPLSLVTDASGGGESLARPDLVVRRVVDPGGAIRFVVELPPGEAHALRISPSFQAALADESAGESEAGKRWAAEATARARKFIDALDYRWRTLRRIGELLVCDQDAFFRHGVRYLAPLTRAEVAARLGVHESTISRAVNGKILQLPDGRLIELGDLFDRSLAAKEAIRQLLAREGPLVDREIAARLRGESICLSRRTIAKYRRQLHIPAAGPTWR